MKLKIALLFTLLALTLVGCSLKPQIDGACEAPPTTETPSSLLLLPTDVDCEGPPTIGTPSSFLLLPTDVDDIRNGFFVADDGTLLYEDPYWGEFNQQTLHFDVDSVDELPESIERRQVMDLAAYDAFCDQYGFDQAPPRREDLNYLIWSIPIEHYPDAVLTLAGVTCDEETGTATIYLHEDPGTPGDGCIVCLFVVPTYTEVKNLDINYRVVAPVDDLPQELESDEVEVTYAKPILYLYPETETELTVTLAEPEALTCSYPAYRDGWHITARPDGTLTDGNREYYALYWEGTGTPPAHADGFVVAREELIPFLEEKLALLGLNERESEEMIVYWLPVLQESPYQFLRFADPAELIPLEFSTEPDTLIRVLLQFKPLEQPIDVEEQLLTTPTRTGFTAVEWGGCRLP